MRRYPMAALALAATGLHTAAAGQDDFAGLMSPEEIAEFRADWKNWSHCAALGAYYSYASTDPQEKEAYQKWAQGAARTGASFGLVQGADGAAFQAETERYVLWIEGQLGSPAILATLILQCHASNVFEPMPPGAAAAPAPAPAAPGGSAAAAVPAPSVPLGYTVALTVNGKGGGVSFRRTPVAGQLQGRWAAIDGTNAGEETAALSQGAGDGSLAGTYATSGTGNGGRYTGELTLRLRGDAIGGKVRFYDAAWSNGDRGFAMEEGPWLHVVYGAAATGLLTPSADGGGWELIWVGPDGASGFQAGKVYWRGSLTGQHMADDPDAGTSFPIEVTERSQGVFRVVLPGGFVGILLKAGG